MIKNSTQNWTVGQFVKVGFLANLLVVAAVPTPGDGAPDSYLLSRNAQYYAFVPHNGLSKIDQVEAREMMADAKVQQDRIAAKAKEESLRLLAHIAEVNELIFA